MPIDEYVFCLDVPMNDVSAMKVFKGLSNHKHELFSLILVHTMLWLRQKIIVKRIGSSVLQNQVDLCACLNGLHQLSDCGMMKLCQQVDFAFQILDLVGFINPLFFINLNGDFLPGLFLHSHSDNSISAFSQLPKNLVLFHFLFAFDGNGQIQYWGFCTGRRFFLLLLRLNFFLLNFVNVIRFDVIFHHCVYKLCIYSLCVLFLLLKGALSALVTRGGLIGNPEKIFPRWRSLFSAFR